MGLQSSISRSLRVSADVAELRALQARAQDFTSHLLLRDVDGSVIECSTGSTIADPGDLIPSGRLAERGYGGRITSGSHQGWWIWSILDGLMAIDWDPATGSHRPVRADGAPARPMGPQLDFLSSTSPHLGFLGGIGSGKTFSLALKLVKHAMLNQGSKALIVAPAWKVLSGNT